MPDSAQLLAFTAAALLLAVIPGPGMLYVAARSLSGGRSVGVRSSVGTAVGGTAHVLAAAVGLSAILATSATAFAVVKYVGAAYLLWLGLTTIRSAGTSATAFDEAPGGPDKGALRQGAVTELLNPKTALFFLTFLPQFCQPENGPVALQAAVLGLISISLNTAIDIVVAFVVGPLGQRLMRNFKLWRRQRQATGGLLVGLGVYTAVRN
ncbi:LysE family translocator [Streptomyces sp. WMMC500]|uniref:LysE family translocator n=1 Tax=Streptomyces sp. WMMC500 TaxID=3015154 RepID=UPI00248C594E|nr:LysE family translocator [Streptomyces sp. WMMC500]WBB63066.1 LysE family translocator [Streptomyces sp. WMMC500]